MNLIFVYPSLDSGALGSDSEALVLDEGKAAVALYSANETSSLPQVCERMAYGGMSLHYSSCSVSQLIRRIVI